MNEEAAGRGGWRAAARMHAAAASINFAYFL